jgi:hypothetical protein
VFVPWNVAGAVALDPPGGKFTATNIEGTASHFVEVAPAAPGQRNLIIHRK